VTPAFAFNQSATSFDPVGPLLTAFSSGTRSIQTQVNSADTDKTGRPKLWSKTTRNLDKIPVIY
jgi:hypothetical protein